MDDDPVIVIQTLQAYKAKLSAQIETIRADIATCKAFQTKYGTRVWKASLEQLSKSLKARSELLKEVNFQLDLVASQVRQGRGLCQKLRDIIGPPVKEIPLVPRPPVSASSYLEGLGHN